MLEDSIERVLEIFKQDRAAEDDDDIIEGDFEGLEESKQPEVLIF